MGSLQPPFNVLEFGEYGVDLFFVISGFIITVTTARNSSVSSFLRKRIIKIVPLYWIITSGYVLIELFAPSLMRWGTFDVRHIVLSFLFIPHYHPDFPQTIWPVVIQGWSLNYELFFYLLFAIALAFSAIYRGWLTLTSLIFLVIVGRFVHSTNPMTITYTNELLLEFAFGIVIGEVYLYKPTHMKTLLLLSSICSILVVIASLAGVGLWRSVLYGTVGAFLLSLFVLLERTEFLFRSAVLVIIGDASYSIYLTHAAVIASLRHIASYYGLNVSGPLTGLAALTVAVALSALFGCVIFVLFERPVTKRLNSWFLRRRTITDQAAISGV